MIFNLISRSFLYVSSVNNGMRSSACRMCICYHLEGEHCPSNWYPPGDQVTMNHDNIL